MPTIHFTGRILPEFAQITISDVPTISFSEPPIPPTFPNGMTIVWSTNITNSLIDVKCDMEPYDDSIEQRSWAHNRTIGTVRALVDLYCFATGTTLSVILDGFIGPDKVTKKLLIQQPYLGGICTVLTPHSAKPGAFEFGPSLATVIGEPEIFLALRDLISGISYPNSAVVDCARAVEGIRTIFWPDFNERDKGWELMRENLRLTQDFLTMVTGTSAAPRHGDRTYIPGPKVEEVTKRAWITMDRFLQYRKRGNQPLPLSEFPLL